MNDDCNSSGPATSSDLAEGEKLHEAFHRCWTQALDSPDYRKADWMLLHALLRSSSQSNRDGLERAPARSVFRVVIGNAQYSIDERIVSAVGDATQDSGRGTDLEFYSCPSMASVEGHVRHLAVDLFVLVLNNLTDCTIGSVLGRVRAFKDAHKKPIVALSSISPPTQSRASFELAVLEAGVDGFVWLPFGFYDLYEKVVRILARSENAKVEGPSPAPRKGRVDFPTEGFTLHWDSKALHIEVTDYDARPLKLTWEDLAAMARTATGARS